MGDRIEILTSKSSGPSRDWLNVVRTSSARSKIRSYFSKVTREDDLQHGRDELMKVLRKQGLGASGEYARQSARAGRR
jgi:GTP pyrophosphokinase